MTSYVSVFGSLVRQWIHIYVSLRRCSSLRSSTSLSWGRGSSPSEAPQLPFVFRWSMALLCRSCLPYLLLSTTGVQCSDSAEQRRGSAIAVHQVRRQFTVVEQKLIPMVLVTMGIPQLQYSLWWSMSLLAARAGRRFSCRDAEADPYGPDCSADHGDSPVAVH